MVKLHRFSGKVTYLVCRAVPGDPGLRVSLRVKVNLRTLAVDFFDYAGWDELPRLDAGSA